MRMRLPRAWARLLQRGNVQPAAGRRGANDRQQDAPLICGRCERPLAPYRPHEHSTISARSCECETPLSPTPAEDSTLLVRDELYDCTICGEHVEHTAYSGQTGERMRQQHVCFTCDYWQKQIEDGGGLVIDGMHYRVGGVEPDMLHPHARRPHAQRIRLAGGSVIEADALRCQGLIPDRFRAALPDNAEFIRGHA